MGIYDRDYERQESWRGDSYGGGGGLQLRMPTTVVGRIMVVTFVTYLLEVIVQKPNTLDNAVVDWLGLHADWYKQPWQAYQLLTTALVHAPRSVMHVAGNMFGLWLFGRDLESRYGSREFLLIYLASICCGSIAWTLGELGMKYPEGYVPVAIGASGGTVAITILYALLYPHRTVLFMFLFPMPMWVLGVIIVAGDIRGAMGYTQSRIAFLAHLGGAAFAAIYYFQRVRLSNYLPQDFKLPSLKPKPKLRVHREEELQDTQDKLAAEVDRILAKMTAQGSDSLTAKEKRTLEQASREFKGRRRL